MRMIRHLVLMVAAFNTFAAHALADQSTESHCWSSGMSFPQATPSFRVPADGAFLTAKVNHRDRLSLGLLDDLEHFLTLRESLGELEIWAPVTPLAVGSSYDLVAHMQSAVAGDSQCASVQLEPSRSVAVVASEPWSPTLEAVEVTGEPAVLQAPFMTIACCEAPDGGEACFDTIAPEQPALTFRVQWGTAVRNQFIARVTTAAGQTGPWSYADRVLSLAFDRPRQEYCAEVELRHLLDANVTKSWAICIPSEQFDDDFVDADDTIAEGLAASRCSNPPLQYRRRWCESNASLCLAESSTSGCAEYSRLCDHSVGEGPNDTEPMEARAGGCQVGGSDAPLGLTIAFLAVFTRRVKRHRGGDRITL